ncbi:hypothetical protein V1477_002208 [Vespula maculifrons]|uniref:Uncharacterized protein n=1 Tax=Vespula maculifrons TaxID=7453 RepID=A0ABD2CYP1_VESMC
MPPFSLLVSKLCLKDNITKILENHKNFQKKKNGSKLQSYLTKYFERSIITLICDYNSQHFGILQPMMLRNQLHNLSTKTEDVKSEMCYYVLRLIFRDGTLSRNEGNKRNKGICYAID